MLIDRGRSGLLVVDVQERLVPAVHETERCIGNIEILLKAAHTLQVPVTFAEQNPQGLGPSISALTDLVPGSANIAKTHFSSIGEPRMRRRLESIGVDQIIIAGMEAHICVLQTSLELLANGWSVYLVADAISARDAKNIDLAVDRMRTRGVSIVSTEMVLFEWLRRSDVTQFRRISALIK